MTISNLQTHLVVHDVEPSNLYPKSPQLRISYTVTSETLFKTHITTVLSYTDLNEDAVQTTYVSSDFYSANVEYYIDVPYEIEVNTPFSISVEVYGQESTQTLPKTVAELTETVAYPRYSIASSVQPARFNGGYLKAFCSFNNSQRLSTYCIWEKSVDGILFEPVVLPDLIPIYVKALPKFTEGLSPDLDSIEDQYVAKPYYVLDVFSEKDLLTQRPDVLPLSTIDSESAIYSFKIVVLQTLPGSEVVEDMYGSLQTCTHEEDFTLDYAEYRFMISNSTELIYSDLPNCTSGKLFYSGNVAYSYGTPELKNNILASNVGELVTPLSRVIDLPARNFGTTTVLVSWRDYLIAANAFEMFLISKIENGFASKVISTFIGIPVEDSQCAKATANGLIFKSYGKIYMFYPNMYSSDESILNLTDISNSVEELILTYPTGSTTLPFAFSTETDYYLIMPDFTGQFHTRCLKYTYNSKVWTCFEYPVLLTHFNMRNVNDIVVYGHTENESVEYIFNSKSTSVDGTYGDSVLPGELCPIEFSVDSGQKTDSLNTDRQFVETKFNVLTLHEKDSFPMRVTVHIDGCPFVTTRDVSTDSAFWKTNESQVGTLNTGFTSDDSDVLNVFRQMFIRYSGKGKSIRHIIEGQSLYPFKIYEIDYRYRNLNVKQ